MTEKHYTTVIAERVPIVELQSIAIARMNREIQDNEKAITSQADRIRELKDLLKQEPTHCYRRNGGDDAAVFQRRHVGQGNRLAV